MTKARLVKIVALLGALLTGAAMVASGDFAAGGGIIAAALSSSTAFTSED